MQVKVNNSGKIYIVNTDCCDVLLPNEYLGTNLSKYVYVDGEWSVDDRWKKAEEVLGAESQDVPLLYNLYLSDQSLLESTKEKIIETIEQHKSSIDDAMNL